MDFLCVACMTNVVLSSSSSIASSSSVKSSSSINVNARSRYDAASNTLTDLRDGKTYKTTKMIL